jgi:hypothetical protein
VGAAGRRLPLLSHHARTLHRRSACYLSASSTPTVRHVTLCRTTSAAPCLAVIGHNPLRCMVSPLLCAVWHALCSLSEVRAGWAIRRVGTRSGGGSCKTAPGGARLVAAPPEIRSLGCVASAVSRCAVSRHTCGTPYGYQRQGGMMVQATGSAVSCIALPLKQQGDGQL